jgi:hypothetical protein
MLTGTYIPVPYRYCIGNINEQRFKSNFFSPNMYRYISTYVNLFTGTVPYCITIIIIMNSVPNSLFSHLIHTGTGKTYVYRYIYTGTVWYCIIITKSVSNQIFPHLIHKHLCLLIYLYRTV